MSNGMSELVGKMFEIGEFEEAGEMPEDFEGVDAVDFVTELANFEPARRPGERPTNRLKVNASSDATVANILLKKFFEAVPHVSEEVTKNAMDKVLISLDFGVMGSDSFMPRLLPNGGFAIRNHHRVVALDDSPALNLKMKAADLHADLALALGDFEADGSEGSISRFMIVHRDEGGWISMTQKLPESFSNWGQTLILVDSNFDLSNTVKLKNVGIDEVCEGSRTGTAVLRTFADRVLVYSLHRTDDTFDTIIEDYSIFMELDEPVTLHQMELGEWCRERTFERVANSDLQMPKGATQEFDHVMSSIFDSYSSEKARQIEAFEPFFGKSPNRPAHYCTDDDPYWHLSEAFEHKFVAVELPLQVFKDFEDFRDRFAETIQKNFILPGKFPTHELRLLVKDAKEADPQKDLVKLESEVASTWLNEKVAQIQSDLNAHRVESPDAELSEAFEECFYYGRVSVEVAMIFAKKPDYVKLNKCMKRVSKVVDSGGRLSVPHMGFYQGYDCGDYDTGNGPLLMTERES